MLAALAFAVPANAQPTAAQEAGCALPLQEDGHVAGVLDGRTFSLDDGREIRLAGIEVRFAEPARAKQALAALIADRDVTLRSGSDEPDRYGRQVAIVFVAGSNTPVQSELLAHGDALLVPSIPISACETQLRNAESSARHAKLGVWNMIGVLKNTESPGDMLTMVGQFAVVEGKVRSVRQAGATTYINFGPHWTRDFAASVARRAMPTFAAAGIDLKSLENKRIRVRGWIVPRGGPRIEVTRVGQIELIGGD